MQAEPNKDIYLLKQCTNARYKYAIWHINKNKQATRADSMAKNY